MHLNFCSSLHWIITQYSQFYSMSFFDFLTVSFHLLQLDGNSHVIYAEEEAAGTRLLIDGRTCLLQVKLIYFYPLKI